MNLTRVACFGRFVLRGDASGEWFVPVFCWHGFRYVAFWWLNCSSDASISSVIAHQMYTNATRASSFTSSNQVRVLTQFVFGYCDNSLREKDWRCCPRGTQTM